MEAETISVIPSITRRMRHETPNMTRQGKPRSRHTKFSKPDSLTLVGNKFYSPSVSEYFTSLPPITVLRHIKTAVQEHIPSESCLCNRRGKTMKLVDSKQKVQSSDTCRTRLGIVWLRHNILRRVYRERKHWSFYGIFLML
jgi:hypothetical protein